MNSKRFSAFATALAAAMMWLAPERCSAQTFALDPPSASLPAIPAASSDLLMPSGPLPAGPPPLVGLPAAELGLLPGDVIDAITFGDDAFPGGPATLNFSVSSGPMGPGVVAPPDVTGESAAFVPAATQDEAASDMFATNDPACVGFGAHTQIVDGNGALIGPPSVCGYGGGAPHGLGLTELLPTPPVMFNDDLTAFDWGVPGRGRLFCIFLSLAPGSPTLVAGGNPLFPAGGTPGDILVSCPGPSVASPPFLGMGIPAAAFPIVSGPPGCAPPFCDDIDALTGGFSFSLSPASPSVTGPPLFSAADVLGFGPAVMFPAVALGLLATDDVNALESFTNPCPGPPGGDGPDFDGVMPGPGCDNCPGTFNPGQEDTDGDGLGDVCDLCTDTDVDGFGNPDFPANACPVDLCPFTPGPNVDTDLDGHADECDNCVAVPNTAQTDSDFDGAGNACDLCPNVSGAAPAAFNLGTLKKAQLGYKNNGPGSSDDSAKSGATFFTATVFDPDLTDTVYVTLTNTATGAALSSTTMAAGSPWTQHPTKPQWKYATAAAPFIKASIKEAPATTMNYKWKIGVKSATLPGPQIVPATDDIRVTIEIVPANLCFDATLTTCTSTPLKKDGCKP